MLLQYPLITLLSLTVSLTSAEPQQPQQQHPLRSILSKIQSYIPSANPQRVVESVIGHTRAYSAAHRIDPLTLNGWRAILKPSTTAATGPGEPEEWWVLVTGRNKTCPSIEGGGCVRLEKAFNESSVIFAAAPSTPHQAILNCDEENVLCHAWAATPPALFHFLIPRSHDVPIEMRVMKHINASTITAPELVKMHLDKSWQKIEPYEGIFHPFDGFLAKWGLSTPVGYVLAAYSKLPSWAPLVVLSILTRTLMTNRLQRRQRQGPGQGQRGAAGGVAGS
ncbi:MAG: 39S ribosomal protein L24, mitochondrial [Watsoniomyces obsoletus]|nr:MAG: 39S ribosomal protein L24, mitochondrial [Watsoniomyces obsoletus]